MNYIFSEIDVTQILPQHGFDALVGCKSSGYSGNNGNNANSPSLGFSTISEEKCCGVFPERFPYISSDLNERECCGQRTYDPSNLCCKNDFLHAAGSC